MFKNKLHYAEITKHYTNKRGTEKKEICHLEGVSPIEQHCVKTTCNVAR